MKVLQVNLHHNRAASAALRVAMKNCDVALIQEPWTYMGAIKGLKEVSGELIYSRSTQNPRTCILIKKGFQILNGFGGLGVACCPLVPKFTGSNPAKAVGFFRAKKSSARLHSEGK